MSSQDRNSFNASFFWSNYAAGMHWQRVMANSPWKINSEKPAQIFTSQNTRRRPTSLPKVQKASQTRLDDESEQDDLEISDEMLDYLCKRMEEKAAMNNKNDE